MASYFAGGFCLGYGGLVKIPPFGIPKELLKIAGEPILNAVFSLLGVTFEGFGEGENLIRFHESSGLAVVAGEPGDLLAVRSEFEQRDEFFHEGAFGLAACFPAEFEGCHEVGQAFAVEDVAVEDLLDEVA